MAVLLLLAWQLAGATPPAPALPPLALPIRCNVGVNCHIQNYFDHDTSAGWHDYTCGTLAYDAHTGTDFRLADLAAMQAGVPVLAATAGTVAAVRDGEEDFVLIRQGRSALKGRDAGNSVRITHADGWETQYSHLKRGSIAVRPGQKVAAGTVLGEVGFSGRTEFPHLDFVVRHRGKPVDPFAPAAKGCGEAPATAGTPLWDSALMPKLTYRSTGLLIAGFATETPRREAAQAGDYAATLLRQDAPALTFWIELFGLQKGDVLELTLTGPTGQSIAGSRTVAAGNKAVWFAFAGQRLATAAWPTGTYTGRVTLRRGSTVVLDEQRSAVMASRQ